MIIESFLPNPIGSDKEGEVFTVFNNGEARVNLSGWHIQDEAGRTFWLYGNLDSNQSASFPLKGSSLVLNNDGETLYLYSPSAQLEDQLSYIGRAVEGQLVKKEVEITEEIKQNLFEDYAFEPLQSNVLSSSPQSPIFVAIAFGLMLAFVAVLLINKIPKSEEEEIFEEIYDTQGNI